MTERAVDKTGYEPVRAIAAEGARVGLTVRRVGAALLVDPDVPFDVVDRHTAWHQAHGNLT